MLSVQARFSGGGSPVNTNNTDATVVAALPLLDAQTVSPTETATFALG